MQKSSLSWDEYYLGLTKHIAAKSKDPKTKVGAIIVDPKNRIVSTGFNGFPTGVDEFKTRWKKKNKKDYVIHAEENCLLFANCELTGCTMYVSHPICMRCAVRTIQAGIGKVITPSLPTKSNSSHKYELAEQTLRSAGVAVCVLSLKKDAQ